MATWSISQQKYIDTPEAPTGQVSSLQGNTQTGSPDILRNVLFMAALKNPKNASKYATILGMMPSADTTGTTASEKSRAQTGISVAESTTGISQKTLQKTGTPQAMLVSAKLNFPFKLGQPTITRKEQDLVDLDSKYFLLTQAVLTAVQGSRPSDYDVKSYQNSAGPNIMLPYYINQQRIINLQNLLRSKTGQAPLPTRPSIESFNQ